ncbi:uncharacterized protein BDZ99DRAFT_501901 [Mytilinidion resinicola]|uniref:Uncharacterized protein n=1 Tax=Mytilinidion resinicola TaxID=574789 RepID=A0A6A6YAC5_9PEZI|nr:uncharacterized protein BDZ99DRAFT_501901 [Mytilinidion resinicola]KAF2805766.1 hypothetical protein BDZ99DRAFT_501901 [Mytilinidion resinicola]
MDGGTFSGINTLWKFSEFVIRLNDVDAENSISVRTIQNVRSDLFECERLLHQPSIRASFDQNPDKRRWIEGNIYGTKCALNEIGLYVERKRSDKERDGMISFGHRVAWVLADGEKLDSWRMEMSACQQSLTLVLGQLHQLESKADGGGKGNFHEKKEGLGPPPMHDAVVDDLVFKSPYSRRKKARRKEEDIAEETAAERKIETIQVGNAPQPNIQFTTAYPPRWEPRTLPPVQSSNQPAETHHSEISFLGWDVRAYKASPNSSYPSNEYIAELDSFNSANRLGPVDPWELASKPRGPNVHQRTASYPLAPSERPLSQSAASSSSYTRPTATHQQAPAAGRDTRRYSSPVNRRPLPASVSQISLGSRQSLLQMMSSMSIESGSASTMQAGYPVGNTGGYQGPVPVELPAHQAAITPYQNPYRIGSVELPTDSSPVSKHADVELPADSPPVFNRVDVAGGTDSYLRYPQERRSIPSAQSSSTSTGTQSNLTFNQHIPLASNPYFATPMHSTSATTGLQATSGPSPPIPPKSSQYFSDQIQLSYPMKPTSSRPPSKHRASSISSYPSPVSPTVSVTSSSSQEIAMSEPMSRATTAESQKRRRRRAAMDAALSLGRLMGSLMAQPAPAPCIYDTSWRRIGGVEDGRSRSGCLGRRRGCP